MDGILGLRYVSIVYIDAGYEEYPELVFIRDRPFQGSGSRSRTQPPLILRPFAPGQPQKRERDSLKTEGT